MDQELSPQNMEKALKICDILSLDDFTLATVILQEADWNLQKALANIGHGPNAPAQQPIAYNQPKKTNQTQQFQYGNFQGQDQYQEYEYNEYEYDNQIQKDLQNKKKMFNNEYVSIPLTKTTSDLPKIQQKINFDRLLKEDYWKHRHQYQAKLLDRSQEFYDNILCGSRQEDLKKLSNSKQKNVKNRKFIAFLHKKYKSRINFTFGTLMLNLGRSYLDKKPLLVYVHSSSFEDNKSIEMLLTQKQIANFINKNCISYGMFDSSDDYETIQKYVPLKNLPAFILFKFNKQNKKEQFISEYIILKKEPSNFIEWLSYHIGLPIKKKQASIIQESTSAPLISTQKTQQINKIEERIKMSDIINQQNLQYEQMQKLYMMKRQQSRLKKQQIEAAQLQIAKLKQQFQVQPQQNVMAVKFRLPLTGKSLIRNFTKSDLIETMFNYIHCYGRQQFEDQWADFDLTQTFPKLSLYDKKQQQISQIFDDSDMENIIVKEL